MKYHPITAITAVLLTLPFSAFGQCNPETQDCDVVTIPEPSTMALFAAGIGVALFVARRKKR